MSTQRFTIHARSICFTFLMGAAIIFSPDVYAGGKGKGKNQGTTEKRVEHQTDWMKSNLNLSADQLSRIEAINKDAAARLQALRDDKTKDEQAKRNEMARIREFLQAEIKIVLNPDQRAKYEEHHSCKSDHKCEHKGHGKKGKGKAKGHCHCCHHHDHD